MCGGIIHFGQQAIIVSGGDGGTTPAAQIERKKTQKSTQKMGRADRVFSFMQYARKARRIPPT